MTDAKLKEAMEKAWNKPGVRCPNHRVQWHTVPKGYSVSCCGLYWTEGSKVK